MAIDLSGCTIAVGDTNGKKIGNIFVMGAKFWGRPNFSGVEDRFKDSRKKCTVLIPNEYADQLRGMGWNVRTTTPTAEELIEFPDREPISSLKVMIDDNASVQVRMGEDINTLQTQHFALIDSLRIDSMDMEIRAWEYDPEDRPGNYSARLVQLVAVVTPNPIVAKYGLPS